MGKVEFFTPGYRYQFAKNFNDDTDPRWRSPRYQYAAQKGDIVIFEHKGVGNASFLFVNKTDERGMLPIILDYKECFKYLEIVIPGLKNG
jgi:hypothetical protein